MSIRSSFFTSQAGDRVYDASDYARRFKDIIRDGVVVDGGGVLTTQNQVTVVGGNMQTRVNLGKSIVQGYTVEVYTAQEVVTHATADALNPRIDRVVVEISVTSGRIGAIKIVQGTPAASPVAPALTRNSDVYQLSLARVLIGTGVTVLTNGNITDERPDPALCGLANVTIGITPPTGNSAVTVTVDNTNFTVITGTNQQAVNDSIDDTFVSQQSSINAKSNLVGGNTFNGNQRFDDSINSQYLSSGTADKRWFATRIVGTSWYASALNDSASIVRNLFEVIHDGGMRIFGKLFLPAGATLDNATALYGKDTSAAEKLLASIGADNKAYLADTTLPTVVQGTEVRVPGTQLNNKAAKFDDGGLVTISKNLATYNNNTAAAGGMIKILLPTGITEPMLKMTIEGYDFTQDGGAWVLECGGYYSTSWTNTSAVLTGKAPFSVVRFGFEGGQPFVLLGVPSTVWQFPKIALTKVMAGYTGYQLPLTGFVMARIATEVGLLFTATPVLQGAEPDLLSITSGFSGTYTGYMKLRKTSNKLLVFNMDIFSGAGNVNLIYTLPVGYRPVETITMPVVRVGSVSGYITIGTDGTVNISAVANAVDIKGSIAYYVA